MSLSDWEANGWIVPHPTSRHEVASLLGVVERNLADAAVEGLSSDSRLGFAYQAALQLARLALAAEGYRPQRERASGGDSHGHNLSPRRAGGQLGISPPSDRPAAST